MVKFINIIYALKLFSIIVGLSQETDSDAESIRSDTNTIKSPESESKGFDNKPTSNDHCIKYLRKGEDE